MTDSAHNTLPESIRAKLAAVRRRLWRIAIATGLVYLAAAVLGYHVGTIVLDRALDLPLAFRAVLLAGAGALLLYLLVRHVLVAGGSAARLSDDEAALWIERRYPLNEELISAVQLSRPADAARRGSPALVGRVIAEAEGHVRGLDVRRAIPAGGLLRVLGLTLVAGGVVAALWAAEPQTARIWWERNVLLQDTQWPRAVDMAVTVEPESGLLPMGGEVEVQAQLLRGRPGRVELQASYERSGLNQSTPMSSVRGTYRTVLENVAEPVRVRVRGGDYTSPWYELQVRPRPKIESMQVWVDYPAYTGLEPTDPDDPLRDGDLNVPQGSRVTIRAKASEPLRQARLAFDERSAVTDVESRELGEREIEAAFTVRDGTRYSFELVSADGFEGGVAARYSIEAIPDRLPEVRFLRPGANEDATPTARIPVEVAFRDDYGLTGAALVYQVRQAGAREPGPEQRIPLPEVPGGAENGGEAPRSVLEARARHVLEVRPTGAAPGDTVIYWAEAVDTRVPSGLTDDVGPEMRGRSSRSHQLRVVQPSELERALQARLKRVRDDLVLAGRNQEKQRDDLRELLDALRADPEAEVEGSRRGLTYAEMDQRRIGRRVAQARDEFISVRNVMEWNDVAKDDDIPWLAELEAIAGRLVEGPIADAAEHLSALRQQERPDPERLGQVVRLEDEIVERIDELVRRLDRWDEFNEVLRGLRDVLQMQERVRERTRIRARADLGG